MNGRHPPARDLYRRKKMKSDMYLILLWLIPVFLMSVATWLVWRGRNRSAFLFAIVVAAFTTSFFLTSKIPVLNTFTGAASTGLAVIATFAAAAALDTVTEDKKMFYVSSGVYGVLMAVSMAVFLLS